VPQTDSNQFETLDEDLVAYLDGQLDPESARQVENRLASEDRVRRRLQELAQSWDMLDQLPHAVADDTFTRSTVQMVALAAENEVAEQQAVEPRRRRRRWFLAGALALVAACCGFFATAKLWSDPNEKLVRDLSTIENVEAYTQVGDIDFLRRLSDEGIFPDDTADTSASKPAGATVRDESRAPAEPPPSGALDTPEQRREYLAKISPQAREELRSKFETFETLSSDEKEKLRELDDKLNADPHEDRLRHVLARYSEWFKTLLTTERAELSDSKKSVADRMQVVRSLRHEQVLLLARMASAGQAKFPQFKRSDIAALHKWMETFAANHESELVKDASQKMQTDLSGANGPRRTQLLTRLAWQHLRPDPRETRQSENRKTILPSDDELKDLKNQLSKPAREDLDADPDKQIDKIRTWVRIVAQADWFNRRGGNRSRVSEDELHRFFETLPTEKKDQLLSYPADLMNGELRMLYFRDVYSRGGAPGDGAGPRDKPDSRDFPRQGGGRRGGQKPNEPNPKKGEDSRTNAKPDEPPDSSSAAKPQSDPAK
jgi:hypothetical protein